MTEQELIQALQKETGARRDLAFSQLVSRYRERLYAVIMGYLGDHDDTDDVLQETFIKVDRYISGFRSDSSLYTWMCRIAMNQSVSFLRRKKLRQTFSLDQATPMASTQHTPAEALEKKELRDVVRKAVDELSEKQKRVFILRYYDELSHAEIAKITGNSEGTIKANFFHALKKVSAYIQEHYHEKVSPIHA